jgi:pimeloyl-ACP methyl ester carboxylesterase
MTTIEDAVSSAIFRIKSHGSELCIYACSDDANANDNDRDAGRTAAPKPPLLLVHGFRAHARWWDAVVPALCQSYQVFTYDFAGMGDSECRPAYRDSQFVDDLLAVVMFIEQTVAQPLAAVIGHSWGGQITLQACARRPDLARQALILDSYMMLASDTEHPALPTTGNRKTYASCAEAVAAFRLSPPQPVDPDLLAALARKSLCATAAGWRWKFDPALTGLTALLLEPLAAQITLPVGVIYGAASALITPARAAAMAALLPAGHGPYALAAAHHHLMLDQPQALAALLLELLARPL